MYSQIFVVVLLSCCTIPGMYSYPLPTAGVQDFDMEHVFGVRRGTNVGAPAQLRLFMPPFPHKRHKKNCALKSDCSETRSHHHQEAPGTANFNLNDQSNNFSILKVAPAQLTVKRDNPMATDKILNENFYKLGDTIEEQSVGIKRSMGGATTQKGQTIPRDNPAGTISLSTSPPVDFIDVLSSSSTEVTESLPHTQFGGPMEAPGS